MLIFLDIDGVMVPAKSWKSPELLNDGFPAFGAKATLVLQHLISDATTIVLTTSHKSKYSIEQWKILFKERNISIEKLTCLPTNVHNLSRKDEILNWFNVNNVHEDFIIIDDDKSLNALPDFLKSNLVQTNGHVGLTEAHLELITAILNHKLPTV